MVLFLLLAVALGAGYLAWKERKAGQFEQAQSQWQVVIENAAGQAITEALDARQDSDAIAEQLQKQLQKVLAGNTTPPATAPAAVALATVHFRFGEKGVVAVEDPGRPGRQAISLQTAPKVLCRDAQGRLFFAVQGRGAQAKLHAAFFASEADAVTAFAAYLARELEQMHTLNEQSLKRALRTDGKNKNKRGS